MRAPTLEMMAPIGVFDSGVGGLSVWRYIVSDLPNERTVYFADQAHVPYGPRDKDEIRMFADSITGFLLNQDVKLIVIACNTASGAALHWLRQRYPAVSFVGMEPAVKPAVERTVTGTIGVIATPTTFEGDLFHNLVNRFGQNANIVTHTCPGLATQIETGELDSNLTRTIIQDCVAPLMKHQIDHLVLGCTHYPFVASLIQEIVGTHVTLIDPAPAVVRQAKHVLHQQNLLAPPFEASSYRSTPQHRMITSGNASMFTPIVKDLTGYRVTAEQVSWQNNIIIG